MGNSQNASGTPPFQRAGVRRWRRNLKRTTRNSAASRRSCKIRKRHADLPRQVWLNNWPLPKRQRKKRQPLARKKQNERAEWRSEERRVGKEGRSRWAPDH